MEKEGIKCKVEAKCVTGMSASDTFCRTMRDMICERDVHLIKDKQLDALAKFEKTNEKFEKFNHLSADRYHRLHHVYHNHTKMLVEMKKDLDVVFRRIRNLKSKLSKQYGEAFSVTSKTIHHLEEELEAEAEATYKEEKPQDSTIQNVDSSEDKITEHALCEAQITNTMHDKAAVGETIEKAQKVYSTMLRPQLSSSDDSYGSDNDDPQDTHQDSSNEIKHDKPIDSSTKHSHEDEGTSTTTPSRPQLSSSDESLESDIEKTEDTSTIVKSQIESQN